MIEKNDLNSKCLSFIELVTNNYIEIPKIQRDYAQGRKSEKVADVREGFLNQLKSYLDSNEAGNNLDFIYGDISEENGENKLIVLDGQQRLTTLFLLHWYTAIVSNNIEDFKNKLITNDNVRFSYNTRQSSSDFCFNLVNNADKLFLSVKEKNDKNILDIIKRLNKNNIKLSEIIKDQTWFYINWKNDLTIQSMLVMIDSINEVFGFDASYYDKLTNNQTPWITFNFLPMASQGFTDELYVRMNARGKELTRFENFKCKFLGKVDEILEISEIKELKSIRKDFAEKIDTVWLDAFWDLVDKEHCAQFDGTLLSFFEIIFINKYALNISEISKELKQTKKNKENIDSYKLNLSSFLANPRNVPFREILQFDGFIDYVKDIYLILNAICKDRKLKNYFSKNSRYNEKENFTKLINNCTSNNALYKERAIFYGYYSYLLKYFKNSINIVDFEHWMRLVLNLILNLPPMNNETDFINIINSLTIILQESDNNIYKDFLKIDFDKLTRVDKSQFLEEKIKILLIEKSIEWETFILKAEKHEYFSGQLAFAISYAAGVQSILDTDISEIIQNIDFERFKHIVNITYKLFDEKGLVHDAKINGRFQRALTAISDSNYMKYIGSNCSFLIDVHRDISWKSYLKDSVEKDENGYNFSYYYNLVDDPLFDSDDFNSLEKICEERSKDKREATKLIALHPQIFNLDDPFSFAGHYFLRWNSDEDIYILKSERMYGYHSELRTVCKYYDIKDSLNITPFKNIGYYATTNSEEKPCFYLDNWEMGNYHFAMDCIWNQESQTFLLKFFDRNEFLDKYETSPNNIKTVLANNGFKVDKFNLVRGIIKSDISYSEIESIIKKICKDFGKV